MGLGPGLDNPQPRSNVFAYTSFSVSFPIKQLVAILAAAATSVFLVAACGGNGGSADADNSSYTPEASTTMTVAKPALTKPQFVAQVNEICREAWVTILDNWDVYTGTQDQKLSERERFSEAVRLSLLAGMDFHIFDNILRLGSPPGEQEEIEEIIVPFQIAVELGWKERWQAYSVPEVVSQFETYNERAERYGLDDCLATEARLRPIEDLSPAGPGRPDAQGR